VKLLRNNVSLVVIESSQDNYASGETKTSNPLLGQNVINLLTESRDYYLCVDLLTRKNLKQECYPIMIHKMVTKR
jgi:hypothetical protein